MPPRFGKMYKFVVVNVLKDGEKKEVTEGEREIEKFSGSVHRLWSLGLVYLQSL